MPAGLKIEEIAFDETALKSRPEHAAILGRIFTSWSLIEGAVAGLLGLMMHAEPRAAVAILETFKANSSRVEAVRKVGKAILDPSKKQEFDDLMKEVLEYAKERNKIAHNIWGSHPNRNDVIYRIPISTISNLFVKTPYLKKVNTAALLAEMKAEMKEISLDDLIALEDRGVSILHKVMTATTQKGYEVAVQVESPNVGG